VARGRVRRRRTRTSGCGIAIWTCVVPSCFRNLELRHRLLQRARAELSARGFLEVETPILTKPTPEGARDYLVPSRVHPGEFYALPQSPQIYKQLLMVAGFDRYFQLARCFRDEDLRADRQPEFTQIDIEAAFVGAEDIYAVTEAVLVALWAEAGETVAAPFPRMSYRDAVERYGVDKPDLRFGLEIRDLTPSIGAGSGDFLRAAVGRGERVHALVAPGGAALSRKDLDALTADAKTMRASGLLWAKRGPDAVTGPGAKAFGAAALEALRLAEGDVVLAVAGPTPWRCRRWAACGSRPSAGSASRRAPNTPSCGSSSSRCSSGTRRRSSSCRVQPPLHRAAPGTTSRSWTAHRSGCGPRTTTRSTTATSWAAARSASWTRRCSSGSSTGWESAAEAERRFGFLLEGLKAGAPPHGGIALGFDRIVMLLAGTDSLRDVIAFPKTAAARAPVRGRADGGAAGDLDVLHLRVVP